jgi:hypothetical protein
MSSLRGQHRREFPQSVRKAAFARCCKPDGIPKCECPEHVGNKMLRGGHIIYEHLDPDGLGGPPTMENCGVYCDVCADKKTKGDNARMAKADRVLKAHYGLKSARKKIRSRGFQKAPPQRNASRPVRRRSEME